MRCGLFSDPLRAQDQRSDRIDLLFTNWSGRPVDPDDLDQVRCAYDVGQYGQRKPGEHVPREQRECDVLGTVRPLPQTFDERQIRRDACGRKETVHFLLRPCPCATGVPLIQGGASLCRSHETRFRKNPRHGPMNCRRGGYRRLKEAGVRFITRVVVASRLPAFFSTGERGSDTAPPSQSHRGLAHETSTCIPSRIDLERPDTLWPVRGIGWATSGAPIGATDRVGTITLTDPRHDGQEIGVCELRNLEKWKGSSTIVEASFHFAPDRAPALPQARACRSRGAARSAARDDARCPLSRRSAGPPADRT